MIEDVDLICGLHFPLEYTRIHPPSEESDKVHETDLTNANIDRFCQIPNRARAIPTAMAQVTINRSEQERKCGHDQHDYTAGTQDRCHSGQRLLVVFNMFQNVDGCAGISAKFFQRQELVTTNVAHDGVQVCSLSQADIEGERGSCYRCQGR